MPHMTTRRAFPFVDEATRLSGDQWSAFLYVVCCRPAVSFRDFLWASLASFATFLQSCFVPASCLECESAPPSLSALHTFTELNAVCESTKVNTRDSPYSRAASMIDSRWMRDPTWGTYVGHLPVLPVAHRLVYSWCFTTRWQQSSVGVLVDSSSSHKASRKPVLRLNAYNLRIPGCTLKHSCPGSISGKQLISEVESLGIML